MFCILKFETHNILLVRPNIHSQMNVKIIFLFVAEIVKITL